MERYKKIIAIMYSIAQSGNDIKPSGMCNFLPPCLLFVIKRCNTFLIIFMIFNNILCVQYYIKLLKFKSLFGLYFIYKKLLYEYMQYKLIISITFRYKNFIKVII